MALVVLLVGEAESTALTKAGRLSSMSAHVGHQQQSRAEAFSTLGAFQDPLMSPGVFLQLFFFVEDLSTF